VNCPIEQLKWEMVEGPREKSPNYAEELL